MSPIFLIFFAGIATLILVSLIKGQGDTASSGSKNESDDFIHRQIMHDQIMHGDPMNGHGYGDINNNGIPDSLEASPVSLDSSLDSANSIDVGGSFDSCGSFDSGSSFGDSSSNNSF
ncbi:MAG: hypothetical protein QHH06_07790 [Clostridiales bacterium]|nr:hypothetical protein [Eubacteriales bacterium]MDH7566370.1 hypothetical protein [Clostridiales bacterium]